MKIQRSTLRYPAQEGQVLILFALMSLVLIGFMALSVDVGYLLSERRQAQSAADAGTLAAAASALAGDSSAIVTSSGKAYGALNANVSDDDVEVNRPPVSGEYAGDNDYIQVIVTKDVERFFLGAIYQGDWSVQASATAGIEPDGFNAAVLALNSDEGGLQTGGSSAIEVTGGSIVSNYDIRTSGSTGLMAEEKIVANDGIHTSGSARLNGQAFNGSYDIGGGDAPRVEPNAPEIPDPLLDKLDPPNLPSFLSNPVPNVNNSAEGSCGTFDSTVPPATYDGGGGSCVNVRNIPSEGLAFQDGDYVFRNNAGINVGGGNSGDIVMDGGTYNFEGGQGINVGGSTPHFEMSAGEYSFEDGATISIGGSAPNNILGSGANDAGDSSYYFSGGGGLQFGGSIGLTLNPGTYVFDGGPGLVMSGSSKLTLNAGTYEFWFRDGADFKFSGSSYTVSDNAQVKMYFYGTNSNPSNLEMSGSTNFNIPSGEYYFDRGNFLASGSTTIRGEEVFLYFKDNSALRSSGSASFGFTPPDSEIYPGYYPGVFMYSDRDNTKEFQWTGSTTSTSKGVIYLPSSPLVMSGSSNGKVLEGQIIADRFDLGGSNSTTVEFVEHVPTQIPHVYLVE